MYPNWPALRGRRTRFLWILTLLTLLIPSFASARREHLVYFPNTAYELNIYKIYGKSSGKTLMLIGGIQGNEPGGFLSADLYADMSLEKGNLIVVPRANFYSIILNKRGANGDMNRKFAPGDTETSMEDKIVAILKQLISESDCLINLHDGSGYYHPKHVSKWRNPMRFGQTVIADCNEYRVPGTDRVIRLGEMAEEVVREVNAHITNDLYKFHFMNTRTGEPDSPHKEQRMSATYYALTKHHIPSFGVETSKFLPTIDLKVRYHNLVINAFKKLFEIVPESPGMVLDPPVLKYLVVSINNRTPIVIMEKDTLMLEEGDSINVTHIESNYERGLSLDILGYGDLNDYRRDFVIFRDTTLIVRKDNQEFAEITIKTSKKGKGVEKAPAGEPWKVDYFVIETQGRRLLLSQGETLHMVRGDKMKILGVLPEPPASSGVEVNFKGFVGDWKNNTGEDRGYVIDTGSDLIKRYSLGKGGEAYEIIVSKGDKALGRLIVKLSEPRMEYMILRVNSHRTLLLRPEARITLSGKDEICLEEIRANLFDRENLHLNFNGHEVKQGEVVRLKTLCPGNGASNHQIQVRDGSLVLGRIFIQVENT